MATRSSILAGESHGQRSLVSYIVHGITKESDMPESLTLSLSHIYIYIYNTDMQIYIYLYIYV